MKLLILISSDRVIPENIKLIDEGIKKTWASREYKDVTILPYYGGNEKNQIDEGGIQVTAKDIGLENIYDKTMLAFKLAYENIDFDIMLRTNVSTYIRPDYLRSILKHVEPKDFFGSTWCHPLDEHCYFSGISLLFSRDVIKKILDADFKNKEGKVDDVYLGEIIENLYPNYRGIYKNFKRLDIMENSILRLKDPLFKINFSNIWAFRCKTPHSDRNLDIEKMKLLDEIFYK